MKCVCQMSFALSCFLLLVLSSIRPATAADADVITLFDGTDFSQWQNANGGKPGEGWVIKDKAMVRVKPAGYIWTKKRFADFVLSFEFKTEGNSGVFFRTDKMTDPVQTGIEMQVERKGVKGNKHSLGAAYDLLGPCKDCGKPGEWNKGVITADDNKITIQINGEKVVDMDLNQWITPNKNPDGTKNKFRTALKDFKREGHIGFQEHGAGVAFRNVRVTVLH